MPAKTRRKCPGKNLLAEGERSGDKRGYDPEKNSLKKSSNRSKEKLHR